MSSKKKKREAKKPVQLPVADNGEAQRKLIHSLGLIIALVAVIQYAQTLSYDFALDDYSAIIENKITQGGIHAIPTIFKTTYRFGYPLQGDELYRPIPKSVFAISWQLFPGNPFPLHLLNVLLYALTGFLLFITLAKFLRQKILVPFFATLLFIAHPLHTEVVANIKSLDEILSFLFFVISLYWLHDYLSLKKSKWLILSLTAYFISLLSKESAITYLAVYPIAIFFFEKKTIGKGISVSALMFIPAIIFLLIRYKVVGTTVEPSMADNDLMATKDVLMRKTSAVYILGRYLLLMIAPLNLRFDYSYNQVPLVSGGDWRFISSFLVLLVMFIYSVSGFRKRDPIAFGLLFFFITISISSNIFVIIGTNMAERLLYVPSLGICFALTSIADRFIEGGKEISFSSITTFFQHRKILTAVFTVIILLSSVRVWSRNPVWKNNENLYESGVKESPDSHRTHFYLGNFLLKKTYYSQFSGSKQQEVIQRGLNELKKSVEIYPQFGDAWLHIGNYYSDNHIDDSAAHYYLLTLSVEPYLATAHNNLGTVYFDQKNFEGAISEFTSAVKYDQNYHDAWRNLGSAYGSVGKFQEAIPCFTNALRIAPDDAETNYYLGITYRSLGDQQNAAVFLNKAASLDPQFKK